MPHRALPPRSCGASQLCARYCRRPGPVRRRCRSRPASLANRIPLPTTSVPTPPRGGGGRVGGVGQVATAPEIQSDLEAAELVATVERALAELPPKRSAVCKLRLIDGLSYAQIADRLGICEKTVETQLARGLKSLRDQIRQAP